MQQTCKQCGLAFVITSDDLAFYDKVSPVFHGKKELIPPPTLCPECRQQRRMSFRNERYLHRRSCDLCSKDFLSIFDTSTQCPVYCYQCWWSDNWDATSYGRAIDNPKNFLDQFIQLVASVPKLGIASGHNENCDYCNYVNYSKDSYLCFGCHNIDDCFHSWRAHWSNNCSDIVQIDKGQFCYECIDCDDCYQLTHSQNCNACSYSQFLYDCRGCRDCIGCIGLNQAQYCIFNVQYSQANFEMEKAKFMLETASGIEKIRNQVKAFFVQKPHRNVVTQNCEEISGDHLINCRKTYQCFHAKDAEDCLYLESCEAIKDAMDATFSGWPAERVYETISAGVQCYNQYFCITSWSSNDLQYCDSCHHSNNLFGCVGLKKKQYCILNKQYTKEEYEALVPKIIEKMRVDGEYGEFFPVTMSPFAYNETVAQEYFPLTKEEVLARGWKWRDQTDEMPKVDRVIPAAQLPDAIDDIPDDILNWAIECDATKRPFKVIKQELEFYRNMQLPVPRFHPDERHRRRMALRNPRKLWDRECAKCQQPIATSYAPERPEIVYCESCYLATVY